MDILTFIIENQLTALKWAEISSVLNDHDKLIRDLALWVSEGNAGKDPERKEYLGIYAEEVQAKINWAYGMAKEVWADKYGKGEERKTILGDDYDLIQFWVERTRPGVFISGMPQIGMDQSGKRYLVKNFPTSKGTRTIYAFPQTRQGSNPYKFSGSGCGLCSVASAIYSIKGYDMTLRQYADKNLSAKGVEGTECPISTAIMERLLQREGITYKRVKSFDTDRLTEIVKNHLSSGNPVILSLTRCNRKGENHKGRYANSEHYAILWGVTEDGKKAFLFDSSGDPNRRPRMVDLWDICDHVPTAREREDFDPIWNGWINCGGVLLVYMR